MVQFTIELGKAYRWPEVGIHTVVVSHGEISLVGLVHTSSELKNISLVKITIRNSYLDPSSVYHSVAGSWHGQEILSFPIEHALRPPHSIDSLILQAGFTDSVVLALRSVAAEAFLTELPSTFSAFDPAGPEAELDVAVSTMFRFSLSRGFRNGGSLKYD